ncbi:MAG: CotS family spore coat protein [Eubacteriales bacterium]|nr:CotS family spore coat protein [Eubacteriales bacterium]
MNEKSLKVLEQYEIEVFTTRRGRGSYICETNQGKKLLAVCSSSEKKMEFVNRILEALRGKGYSYADIALRNKEGNLLTPDREDEVFVLKDWYEGRECDTKSLADTEMTVRKLASLHKLMCVLPKEDGRELYQGENLYRELERRNRELRKVYSFIRRRKQKNGFEILFLNSFSTFYEQAQEALERLDFSECEALRTAGMEKGRLCHGNFNQHNVWFTGRGQVFVGNFEKCRYDVQVLDLYQFMRKIMEKQEWSRQMGYRILEGYDRERTMDDRERDYMYTRLLYPEKFWKLANQYYNHNKSWVPEKSAEKLKTLMRQQEARNSFLKTLE